MAQMSAAKLASLDLPVWLGANRERVIATALTIVGAILLAWMMLPIFTANHFEAVSYTTSNLSLGDLGTGIFAQNPRQPIVPEFIYATRPGMVAMLQGMNRLTGSPDASYRLLVILSCFAMLAALWTCARAWIPGPVPAWCYVWAAALLPGFVELGYLLNDNVVSVAIASLSVAALARAQDAPPIGLWRYALSGALAALAVYARVEAVLVAPILLVLARFDRPGLRATLAGLGTCTAAGLAALAALAQITGYNLLEMAGVIVRFGNPANFGDEAQIVRRMLVYALAIGLPATVLIGLSVRPMLRERNTEILRFALVFALALIAIAIKGASIPRYVYPVSYILVLPLLVYALARLRNRIILLLLVGLSLGGMNLTLMLDGPRTLLGEARQPYYALLWQRSVADNRARFAPLLDAAETDAAPTAFLTGFYNEEYLLKLMLRERGYREAGLDGSACDAVAVYRKGPRAIGIIPVDDTYAHAPGRFELIWALAVLESHRCPLTAGDRAVQGHEMYGTTLRTLDPVQKAAKDQTRNSPYKEVIAPVHLDAVALQQRRDKACAIVAEDLGSCDPDKVHARYQTYLSAFAMDLAVRPAQARP